MDVSRFLIIGHHADRFDLWLSGNLLLFLLDVCEEGAQTFVPDYHHRGDTLLMQVEDAVGQGDILGASV
ncbi:hypothetical protein [uncultured Tateyamaria sp.]|uniref:hypothetical protein n=1 Tax=uncultured Tateyamaria sp. TaxID=455651 RepID=UPI00262E7A60|nr:hypothetical protein [uncultured Tateyamaria sp.]